MRLTKEQQEAIIGALPENIEWHADQLLSAYTFTKTGGAADLLALPRDEKGTSEIIRYANDHDIPWQVLGNASNLIVRGGGIAGIVIMLNHLDQIKIDGERLTAGAGAKLIDVSRRAKEAGLTGLEFACGIPGSAGGAVYMNAGAYEGEISQVFSSCEVITASGKQQVLGKDEMAFRYRHSRLQEDHSVLVRAAFQLKKGTLAEISEKMAELTQLRESKQPLEYPSCGSVFKRPEGHFTGKLIQEAGLQGRQIGGAQVSMKHAGFIVNKGGATATDYIELIQEIQRVVAEKFGIHLETEVRIIGED